MCIPKETIRLLHREPDIYVMDVGILEDRTIFDKALEQVSAYRRKKVLAFRFSSSRILSLGAGILMEEALSRRGMHENQMEYRLGPNEKPYFANAPSLFFNASHSGKMAMLGISDQEIGCDIEIIGKDNMNIAEHFYHPDELRYLQMFQDKEEQKREFYRLWTLKESYVKVTGKGLSEEFSGFCIDCRGEQIVVRDAGGEKLPYSFGMLELEGYAAAWCRCNNNSGV
ncbi:MAG: 4'-phosphopantetheinyl transferase superfamily protein [Blautia sp.]|nr:4'-phosphopantetheinyl transferase superfamily protein [Blautia sp.]